MRHPGHDRRPHRIQHQRDRPASPGSFDANYDLVAWTDIADSGFTQINEFSVSGISSHEVGHALGLEHDGGSPGGAYYEGHGSGETRWTTIMGNIWPGDVV